MSGETTKSKTRTRRRAGRRPFGSVRPCGSGRYQASYPDPGNPGKRINAPDTFRTVKEADDWLANIRSEITRGVLGKPKTDKMTFGEYAERWLTGRPEPLRPNSLNTYRTTLRLHILPTFGSMQLGAIEARHVSDWWAEMGRKVPAPTRRYAYRTLHSIMATAAEQDDRIPANPCKIKGVHGKKPTNKKIIGPEAVAEIVKMANPRYQAMILINMYGHLRHGELIGLRRGDIDWEAGTIRVEVQLQRIDGQWVCDEVKTEAGKRTLSIPSAVMDALAKHVAEFVDDDPDARVFTTSSGNPFDRRSYNRMLRNLGAKVGQPDLHSHRLRRGGLTVYAHNGATLEELLKRGGHTKVDVALLYQVGTEERDKAIAERMNANVVIPSLEGKTRSAQRS